MNKFYMNGKLIHKASNHNTKRCEVEKWVFLPHSDFERLKANQYQEHEAITAARDLMYENKNAYHCIMLLDEYGEDGLLIEAEGFDYPHLSMFVPDAKSIYERYQTSESELKLHDMIKDTVEKIAELAHKDKTDFTSADIIDMDEVVSLVKNDIVQQLAQRYDIKMAKNTDIGVDFQLDIHVEAEKLTELKFYCPLKVQREINPSFDEDEDEFFEDTEKLSDFEVIEYESEISDAIEAYQSDEEENRGIMAYLGDRKRFADKVYSIFPSVEKVGDRLMGVFTCQMDNMESGRGIFKGNLSTIVVDEAYNLESKFRDAFTKSFSQREISREIMKVTSNRKNTLSRLIIETIRMIDTYFNFLKNDISQQQAAADADMKTFYYRPSTEIKKLVLKLRSNMKEIEMRTNRRLHSLQTLRDSESNANLVWLSNEHGVRINVCRKDIRRDIGRLLFSSLRSTILTSATLTSQNSGTLKDRYGYFMDSLGCPDDICISEPKKSPYNYDEHSMMCVSNKLPCPKRYNRNRYRQEAIAEIVRLLKITHGKTLILFTAKDDRDYVFGQLTSAGLPYKIMIQSSDSSQEQRLENFRKNVDSVILGTGTYWEGINVEGESLSQVIIFKLPFPVPEPIMEYKMSKAECPLLEVAVPEMVIKLKQGAGRLIRNAGDKGIVSILDPRASSRIKTAYREDALSSLPENNTTENITELKRFWR